MSMGYQCSPEVLLDKSIEKWLFCFYKMGSRFLNATYLNFLAGYFKICGEHYDMESWKRHEILQSHFPNLKNHGV